MAEKEVSSVTSTLEKEKMEALKFYLEKEKTSVPAEMQSALLRLYEVTVPEDVRIYLEGKLKQ